MSDTSPSAVPSAPSPAAPAWRQWAIRVGRVVLVSYVVVVLILMWSENRLIFPAGNSPADNWRPSDLPFEDIAFTSSDGTKLHGWYVPHENPVAVVQFNHGNGGNLTHRAHRVRKLHQAGASVFIYDYRGYGKSEGSPSEAGVMRDARAARAWLAQRAGVAEPDIVQVGESLGGGVAVDLAARDGARGLVLECTFTSLPDVAALKMPWWIPVRWIMRNRFDSISKIGDYHGPLLQSHGDQDTLIPLEIGQTLFNAANQPKEFLVLEGATHNDRDSIIYDRAQAAWLQGLGKSAGEKQP